MDFPLDGGKIVGKNLRKLRKLKNITQAKLADDLGLNYRHYQDIEPGKADIKMSTLVKLGKYFRVPLQALFYDSLKKPLPLCSEKFMSNFAIALHDLEGGRYVDVCDNVASILGQEKGDLLQSSPSIYAPPKQWSGADSEEFSQQMISEALKDGERQFEWTGNSSSGVFTTFVRVYKVHLGDTTFLQSFGELPKNFIPHSDPQAKQLFS